MDYTLTFVALLAACGIGYALHAHNSGERVRELETQLLDYQGREWQQMGDEGELDTLRLTNAELSKVARSWLERALAAEKRLDEFLEDSDDDWDADALAQHSGSLS